MKIQREELLKVLRRVAPVIKVRTTIAELSTVKIRALNNNFRAVTTDMDSYCEASCGCKGDLEPVCVAPGPLIAVCSYGPETIELLQDGPLKRLRVKSGSVAELATMSPEHFPEWPKNTTELGVNADDLREAIQSVMWVGDHPDQFCEIKRQSVWVIMDTKDSTLQAVVMDGKRFAWFKRSAVVPNAQIRFMCSQASILCDTMTGSQPKVKLSDSFVEARTIEGSCAIKQTELFTLPIKEIGQEIAKAVPVGNIPKQALLTELATIKSVAIDPFPVTKATFTKEGMSLDYVGKVNEFHSMVPVDALAKQPEAQRSRANTLDKLGSSVDLKPSPATHSKASDAVDGPLSIAFDANLLHSVIKNTPGENIACKVGERMIVFESGDVTTALALIDPKMYP